MRVRFKKGGLMSLSRSVRVSSYLFLKLVLGVITPGLFLLGRVNTLTTTFQLSPFTGQGGVGVDTGFMVTPLQPVT